MNKLIEQSPLKKSRFLKYSLLASISVGAIIAAPFEGIANSESTENLVSLSQEDHNEAIKNDKTINILKKRPKSFNIAGGKKKRPPTRKKILVDNETKNTYTPEPTEQTPQKSEIIITEASPTSTTPDIFVTAPNTPNTTQTSPEHIDKTAYSTPLSSPGTLYQSTPKSKPNGARVNKVVSTKPQKRAPVTKIPIAGSFLNQQQTLDANNPSKQPLPKQQTRQQKQRGNKARKRVVVKNNETANEVKRNSAEYKDLINERERVQLEQKQRHVAAEKTKKQQQAENKQRSEREKKRKEENHQKEKAKDIVEIREDIAKKMQQILNTDTTLQATLHKLQELKVEAIEDKKKKQEAQKQLSEIKKQEKAIKTAADKAQKILNDAKNVTSRTALRAMQDKMNGYSDQLDKIEENLKLVLNSTILTHEQPPKVMPTMPLTRGVQGILNAQENDGYEVPIKAQPQTYITVLPDQEVTDPKSIDSGFESLLSVTLGKETDEDAGFGQDWENEHHIIIHLDEERNERLQTNSPLQHTNTNLDNDPELTELATKHINLEEQPSQLQSAQNKPLLSRSSSVSEAAKQSPESPKLSCSSSVSSLNSLFSDEDLLWDNTEDVGVGHRYGVEYSCPTPDQSSSSETKLALLRTYQMAVMVKRQELEQLLSISSEADQIAQKIEELEKIEEITHNALSEAERDPLAFDQRFSFEEINNGLKKYGAELMLSLNHLLSDEDNDNSSDSYEYLAASDEESEDEEVTESVIQEASGQLSSLPALASSNEYVLALSDGREYEDSELEDKDYDNDSGIDSESEEEAVDQLSDSKEDNLKTTEVDTAISLKQEVIEEAKKSIAAIAPTLNQGVQVVKNISKSILGARLDSSEALTAVAAGDEEEPRIKRGLWMRGMYGTNNHGRVDNMTGYKGINKGATIGFDVEIDNNIVGIAYSNVHSVFKFKNSKNNDKELINSHVVSIYGQKELPKNFVAQALASASKNFIKDKTTYSYGDTKIRSNVKHRNHSYNAEALLNYNYLLQNKLVITPNIGLRYGKSRDGVYNETSINVQEIALTMKENNILSGIVGTKVKVPLKDALKFNNLGLTFQGAVEHNFKEKTQRINRVVKIFDNTFKQDYLIPKQPKTSYNLGAGIMGSIKNTIISLDYNYYLNKHYRSHQGSVKLKVNL